MRQFLLILFTFLASLDLLQAQYNSHKYPWVQSEVWQEVDPYLIPLDHPLKHRLDKIFGRKRATLSIEAMQKAGFQILPMGKKRKIVAKHPSLKGYLVKTYLDYHQLASEDWRIWRHRVIGARYVQACLDRHGYNGMMKVPKKWLYPLPLPSVDSSEFIKFVLVVEDMQPLKGRKNKNQFKKMNQEQVEALFIVLKENLLHDSIYIHNIPFCKDGKIAFLDLEHYNSTSRRVRFERLTPYFSSEMQTFWQELMQKGAS